MSNLYIAADHAGFQLKETLASFLKEEGHIVVDCGAYSYDADDDYPDFVSVCAHKVVTDSGSFGIVIGASGQGEAMVANRVTGIRAAVYYGSPAVSQKDAEGIELDMISSVRAHNDANILALGARFLTAVEAQVAVRLFLEISASTDTRHVRRREKLR